MGSIDCWILRRANSVPSLPSSPTTGASSETIFNTPTQSDAASSPALSKFHHAINEHRKGSKKCNQALADYLKGEEKEIENADWAAIVEWVRIGNTTEVEKLRKERSEVRRRLEMRSREIRAMKREMKELKESLEETKSQSIEESDAESGDEDEGGVLLPDTLAAPTEMV